MAVSALRWFKSALVLQVLLLAYWLAIETIPLFPWNDVASRPASYEFRTAVFMNALPLLAFLLLFSFGVRVLGVLSVVGYAVYLATQLWRWWKPYALGADAQWQSYYAENFSRTLKIVPAYGTHLPPDANQIALQALVLIVMLVTGMAVARMRYL